MTHVFFEAIQLLADVVELFFELRLRLSVRLLLVVLAFGGRLRTQQWEVDDVANPVAVSQQHNQSVDTDSQTARRWHADLQSFDEVRVHLGHGIFFRQTFQLCAKRLFLQVRIVEFCVSVGQFHAMDEQFEPLRDVRVVLLPFCQRADRRRVIDHENRANQRVLDLRFEDIVYDDVRVNTVGFNVQRFGQRLHGIGVVHVDARVFFKQIRVLHAGPWSRKVDGLVRDNIAFGVAFAPRNQQLRHGFKRRFLWRDRFVRRYFLFARDRFCSV